MITIRDRFELLEVAGRGGMGEVWRARDLETGRPVAVKLLRTDHEVTADDTSRFVREATALASLEHPRIVRYLEHGVADSGALFLAMEWLEGETLAQRLERAPLSHRETLAILRAVAEGLEHAHAHGIVHRDVKPQNLLLHGGHADDVRIIDFGVARDRQASRMTSTGAMVGTAEYIAPEQARGLPSDARADVFSLGCVAYELLAGRTPFAGENFVAVLAKILLDEAPPLSSVAKDVPKGLSALVHAMLEKPPDARPRSMKAVLAALERVHDPSPTSSADAGPAPGVITTAEQRVFAVIASTRSSSVEGGALVTSDSRAVVTAMRTLVAEHGGSLDVLATGAMIASFVHGASPHELAERAVRCALALRRLAPGEIFGVVVGRGITGGALPVGQVLDRAGTMVMRRKDLRAEAEWAEIPISVDDVTAAMIEGRFSAVRLPGGEHVVTREAPTESPRSFLGKPTPTVGRERELTMLDALLDECASESVSRVALVTGTPGAGKTRLVREAVERFRARVPGTMVLTARGDPMSADAPFGLLAAGLRRELDLLDGEPAAAQQRKIGHHVAARIADTADQDRVTAFLAELVALRLPNQSHPFLRTAREDPSLSGDLMRASFEEWLAACTTKAPVIVVLDDLQWGDRPSIGFVDSALRNLRERPLLVVAAGRPELDERFGSPFAARDPVVMRLPPLTKGAAGKLLAHALEDRATPARIERIVALAEGNPFFLEELARAVVVSEGAGGEEGTLPETVLGLVQVRLERLPAECRRVLRAASIYGATFWRGAVAPLLGMPAAAPELERALSELEKEEIVVRRQLGSLLGDVELRFRNALVRDAAYAMLTDRDRLAGHRTAAQWLALRTGINPRLVAEHLDRGGAEAEAREWWTKVAERALEGNDFAGAITAATRALANAEESAVRGRLHGLMAEAERWKGNYPAAVAAAMKAAEELPVGSTGWFHALGEVFLASGYLAEHDRIEEVVTRAMVATAANGAESAQVVCLARAAAQLLLSGRDASAARILERIDALAVSIELSHSARAWRHWIRSTSAQHAGDHHAYITGREAARTEFLEAGDQRTAATIGMSLGYAHALAGNYARAEGLLREALSSAERLGIPMSVCYALHNLGLVLARRKMLPDAIAIESRALALAVELKHTRLEGASRLYLAQILIDSGRAEDAEREARAAGVLLSSSAQLVPLIDATLGRALLSQGRIAEAMSTLDAALAGFERLSGSDEGESYIRLAHVLGLLASRREAEVPAALARARGRILERGRRLVDDLTREQWMQQVPENLQILDLASEWCDRS